VHSELAGSGIAVFGMDAHGHGRSEPRDEDDRALVHAFSHLVPVPKAPSPLRTVEC
jgi:alpha-beta hydrolase superfamily lysophospholipase